MRDFGAKEGGLITSNKLSSHTHLTPGLHYLGGAPVAHPILGEYQSSFSFFLSTCGLHTALVPEQVGGAMQ